MKTTLVATSTADQEIVDQNSPSPVACHLFSNAVTGQKTPTSWGDQESMAGPSNKGDSPFADFDATKRSVIIKMIQLLIKA